jgi:hypothetical protein
MKNKGIIGLELIVIVMMTYHFILPDWDKVPVVKDYFSLLIIGEIGFDLYLRLKDKL